MHRCLCLKQLLPDQAVSDAQTAQPCMTAYYNYHNTYDSAFTGLCKLAHSWGHVSEVHSIKETMHRSAFELCCSIQQARSCLWSARRLPFVSVLLLLQVQDSGARLLATLSASYRPARMHLAQGQGLSLLLQLLRAQACSNAALGNISLCVGDLAREPQLLPVLQQQDAVAPLLGEHLDAPPALAHPPSNGSV